MTDDASPAAEEPQPERRRAAPLWLQLLAVVALVAGLLYMHLCVVRVVFVTSGSMLSTIGPGDRLIVHVGAYRRHPPQNRDVIVFLDGSGAPEVKRVVGRPGDEVAIRWGIVFRNGKQIDEPYVDQAMIPEPEVRLKLGEGELYLMGDNRNGSEDSRDYGPVTEDRVLGRVVWRLLPLRDAGPIR